ncbi:hypothetical protein L6R52_31060 [Myxococcota bacterium]|nr:hypothetical protein [Myxococcota bacterium]
MSTLKDILLTPENRPKVVRDTEQLVESEVDAKGGISGIAIKAGFKTVKTVKPGLIPDAVNNLLDRFVDRLEPFYAEWHGAGRKGSFESFLTSRASQVANALLGVTDDRARQVSNQTVKKAYETLRPQGEKHVSAAVPGLGRVIGRYL